MRLICLVFLGAAALVAAYDADDKVYVDDHEKVYKSVNKDYKDDLDEELHKSYDTDGKELNHLSDDDYEPPKDHELVEHVDEDEKKYMQLPPPPPWMYFPQFYPFGFPPSPFHLPPHAGPSPPLVLPGHHGGPPAHPPHQGEVSRPHHEEAPRPHHGEVPRPHHGEASRPHHGEALRPHHEEAPRPHHEGAPQLHHGVAPHPHGGPAPLFYYPAPPRYMTPMVQHPEHPEAKERHRRGTDLVKKVTVKDDSEWWFDIDGGNKDEVTERLKIYPGFAAYKKIEEQMDHYAPALHIGTINRGYFNLPEHEQPGDRSFGKGMDFNVDEMDAFRFTPHGQHVALDMYELEHYLKQGKLPIGMKFIVSKNIVNHYSNCWKNKYLKKIPQQEYVDQFSADARALYWDKYTCKAFQPGVYMLVGLKKSYDREIPSESDHGYDDYEEYYDSKENYVLFLKGTDAHTTGLGYVAIDDFNPIGLQEWSPVHLQTAQHKLTNVDEYHGIQSVSEKTMFNHAAIPGLFGHEDTHTGIKIGQEQYKYKHGVPVHYENSIYGTATGFGINAGQEATVDNPAADLHFGHVINQPHAPHNNHHHRHHHHHPTAAGGL